LERLSRATIGFGREEEAAWGLDDGRSLDVARSAARRAVVETLQPIYDQALAELRAATEERLEMVRRC
jgi:hypothetical protein